MKQRSLSGGVIGWYFIPPSWATDCPLTSEPLGANYESARDRVHGVLLPQFDAWLEARKSGAVIATGPAIGSLDWLFAEYTKTWDEVGINRLKPLGAGQQRNHRSSINLIADYKLKNGQRLGERQLRVIDELTVQDLFKKLLVKTDANGKPVLDADGKPVERRTTVNAAMKMCRTAWNKVGPHHRNIIPALNPFAKMGLISSKEETPTATREELIAFVECADRLNYSSIGTAALIAFEWVQRERSIFATFDASHYRPEDHPDCVMIVHDKTDKKVWWPLFDETTGEPFFPELMARLDALHKDRVGLMLVRDWGDRGPWPTYPAKMKGEPDFSQVARTAREIITAAGLRPELTFRSFRHGGMTEAGESDMTDREITAQSGHTSPKELPVYSKRTLKVVANGIRKRLARRSPTATAARAVALEGEPNVLKLTNLWK